MALNELSIHRLEQTQLESFLGIREDNLGWIVAFLTKQFIFRNYKTASFQLVFCHGLGFHFDLAN